MTTLVIAEHDNATVKGATLNTVTAAAQCGGDVHVLIAGSILGVVGAILAVPFAAVIKTLLHEAGAPRRARMAAMREG